MANIINSRMTKDRKYLCHTYREANLNLTVPEPEEWKRTNIARAAIQQYRLSPLISIEDTMAFIEKEMGRVPSVSATTLDTQTDQIKAIVLRALEFDGRRWNNGYPKEFEFAGQIIKARPDYWIESEVEVDGNTYIWHVNKNNYHNKSIYFTIDSFKASGSDTLANIVLIGVGILAIGAGIWVYFKVKNSNN